ncbi:HAMP domain-containing sensor histidine kinase [Streptomyces sp. PT12]|uniref:sensor histidine kinase n=1 Tax=Streptomyces sp. PT12 TaxID=1510197 RepID=UPI000DE570C2|nr:HAMP domain-containing sensor histidine kinase [Streptomyces sp. PT12]RBM18246.1 two-component sensor histidine kinase [Streptomyces sp. PT12]
MTGRTTTTGSTTTDGKARAPSRFSARFRILVWLLVVMTVALATVVLTTRSILQSDLNERIAMILTQETAEFDNFVTHGRDPETGQPFTDARQLLTVHLQRQFPEPTEELLGFIRESPRPTVIRQPREISTRLPLYEDRVSLERIADAPERSGTLRAGGGEVRWAKVPIAAREGEPAAMFIVAFHADRGQSSVNNVVGILLAISGVALLMTCAVSWAVAGSILAPVRLVRATAAQLTEQDLTRRIPIRGRDDISALAETFNAMLDRLERAFAVQRRFVDDAGHELRTPITIVRGHLELMSQGEGPDSVRDRRETVRLVTDELDRMSRIVEDLLLLAKTERPDFVQPAPVQLAELTADVFVKARALGDRRWELAGVAECEMSLDAQRITQAMVQLAQNAVQHTEPGQRVWIGSQLTDRGARLYVADTGPGVPAEDAEVIFERFRRGTTAGRRGSRAGGGSGAGLGLSIVKAIAEGHHGRVELWTTPGGGATFELVLETS